MSDKNQRRSIRVVNQTRQDDFACGEIALLSDLVLRQAAPDSSCSVRVILVTDPQMKIFNRRFFNKQRTTDVISCGVEEARPGYLEGEIYISLDSAARQAKEYQVTLLLEVLRLAAHGLYHLLGYDDASGSEREVMRRLEDEALKRYQNYGVR